MENFPSVKTPSVSFTGGEPTLIPELPALIRYAKELGDAREPDYERNADHTSPGADIR